MLPRSVLAAAAVVTAVLGAAAQPAATEAEDREVHGHLRGWLHDDLERAEAAHRRQRVRRPELTKGRNETFQRLDLNDGERP
jgi:hypothetical protein